MKTIIVSSIIFILLLSIGATALTSRLTITKSKAMTGFAVKSKKSTEKTFESVSTGKTTRAKSVDTPKVKGTVNLVAPAPKISLKSSKK